MKWADAGATYRIPHGIVRVGTGAVETVYDDGVTATGLATFNDEQRARAAALGYGTTDEAVWEMHKEHELLHSVVAEAMGKERSDALYGWSSCTQRPGEIPLEERIVFLVQRTLNVGREILEERRITNGEEGK